MHEHCTVYDAAVLIARICAGKTSIVRVMASLCNRRLVEISLTAGTDTSDILGGFEQFEAGRQLKASHSHHTTYLYFSCPWVIMSADYLLDFDC